MTYTQVTRQQLNRTKTDPLVRSSSVPANSRSLKSSETGLNNIYPYRSHKYGCSSISLGSSSDNSTCYKSISHTSYTPPIYEKSKSKLRSSSSQAILRPSTSGFTRNTQSFQGAGWLGVTYTSPDRWTTEYRSKINPAKPMQNPPLRPNTRSLIKNNSFCI